MNGPRLLVELLDYLLEQGKEVDPRGFKLSQHQGFIKAKPELQGLPGVDFDLKVEGDHIWMRVARLEAARPPALSNERLKGLVVLSDDPNGPDPKINEAAFHHRLALNLQRVTPEERPAFEARVRESVNRALADYTALWTAWAEGEKPRRRTISLYGDLFALRHQLQSEETAKPHELVWGFGVSSWKLSYAERSGMTAVDFQYPLLTQAVELGLEEKTLAIELRPRAVDPRFEFDAFSACQLPRAADVEKAAREALARSADRPVNPFDPGSFEHLLKLIAGNLHEKGRFLPGADTFPPAGENLIVSDAWAILVRPRSNNHLHEDIERLKARIMDGADIPPGPLALVTPPSDEMVTYEPIHFRGLSGGSSGAGKGEAKELYFPLPYNHEQVTIVEQLERSTGVAVQGPPGTGKTHTIANIICHYLATGKKVLVTSKGEQALEVLQSKIPEAVRPLTVALLSGDREGLRQFQTSIEAITHRVSQLNIDIVREQIRADESAIDRAHAELAAIDRRVNEIAFSQLSHIEVDGAEMNAQKMAEFVLSGAERFSWFEDAVSLDAAHAPPLSGAEAASLRESRRRLGQDLVYVSARIPSSAALPPAADIGRLHEVLANMREIEAAEATGGLLRLRATTPEVLAEARTLLEAVEAAANLASELEETGEAWIVELRHKCGQATFASERQALEALFGDVEALIEARAEFLKRPVEVPENALAAPKAREAIGRAAETGKPFPLFSLGTAEAKEQLAAIRVAGLAPASTDDWRHVRRYGLLHEQVLSFSTRWNELAELLSIPKVQGGVNALRHIELVSVTARKAHRLATHYDSHLPRLAERVFAEPPTQHLKGTSVNESACRIETAGAPKLGARIRTRPVAPSGEDEVFPVSWRDAWNWARLKAHLDTIEAREELRTLAARRRDLERVLAKRYESMVSNAAWLSTKLGASPKVLSALETYRTAVGRVGKGMGPNAIRYRRDAQKAMLDAQGAVPCWVMSHAKVSETLPAQLGCFDLVIVDEASQSDLWALPAVLRGKKILVVGDDKQVSPDGGFIAATYIQELKDRFLSNQPYAAELTPDKSLYDLASAVFAANKVMLREHFRCVTPIIAFSNRIFYKDFIQPLRIPKASERIDPPLVDIYVEGGTRGIKDINRQEAEAIAEEIQAILNDRRFAGRTLGVVSLLGHEQAKHIDTEVRRRCDAAELLRRRFACGDARLFQGSERDIVFLSMVVDPANRKAVPGRMFEQRFNVAASRARDRMYLVRSVQLSDLSQADLLRRGLLEHFSKPLDSSTDETKSLIDQCESGFEKQVYTELFSRGYRVMPQVRAGSFRIDMVVEGANDTRLALECDGDEFHGPDRWAADMSRQRVLERAGWTFWRCFASTWAMRKEEVLQELLHLLTAMGIEPLGALERIPSLVEYRPWRRGGLEEATAKAAGAALEGDRWFG